MKPFTAHSAPDSTIARRLPKSGVASARRFRRKMPCAAMPLSWQQSTHKSAAPPYRAAPAFTGRVVGGLAGSTASDESISPGIFSTTHNSTTAPSDA